MRNPIGRIVFTLASLMIAAPLAGPAGAQAPRAGGTLRVGLHAPITSLDPHTNPNQPAFWVDDLVYSKLVQYDEQLTIRPDLATSWEQRDPTTYVFRLRKGVLFHNGREVTAQDVKYSLERILDPATGSSRRRRIQSIDRIEVPDPYTVVIRLKTPNAILLDILADPAFAIVPREVVQEKGNLHQVAVGSGPFMLSRLTPDGGAVLVRNPRYYEPGKPYLDAIEFRVIPDTSARITAVRAGDIDLATFLVTHQIELLRRDPAVSVTGGQSGQFYFLAFNFNKKPLDDPKVRQAIAWAIDRDAIVAGALSGEGFALNAGPIPPWHPAGIKEPIYQPDLARARKLLDESSARGGFDLTIRVWAAQDYAVDAASLIQQQLAPLGIRVRIDQQADWPTYWNAVEQGNYQSTIQGYGGNVGADDWLYERFRTGGGSNVTGYSDPAVDEMLDRARTVTDEAARLELFRQVQRRIAEAAPMVFLFNMRQAEAVRKEVKGFYHMPNLLLSGLKETWLER